MKLLKVLLDEHSLKILAGTFKTPKTVLVLSKDFNIPVAVCYRRVHDLESFGLIKCIGKVLKQNGHRIKLYRSQLKSAHLTFANGKLRLQLELPHDSKIDADMTWDMLI